MQPGLFNAINLIKLFCAGLVVTAHYAAGFFQFSFYSFGTGGFFLIAGYYALNWEHSRGLSYIAKRLLRLYPGYMAAVIAILIVKYPISQWPEIFFHHAIFLLAAPDQATVFSLNPPFWSMPVFFTFFVLLAFLPAVIKPRLITVIWLASLPFAAKSLGFLEWREGYLDYLAVPMHLYAFWLGGWVGYKAREGQYISHQSYTLAACCLMLLIVLIGANYQTVTYQWLNSGYQYRLLMVTLFAALFWCWLHSPLIQRKLALINWLGTISFGIFLFHMLPMGLLRQHLNGWSGVIPSIVISIVLAWLSWTMVESPLQRRFKPLIERWRVPQFNWPGKSWLAHQLHSAWSRSTTRLLALLTLAVITRVLAIWVQTAHSNECLVCLILSSLWQDLPLLAAIAMLSLFAGRVLHQSYRLFIHALVLTLLLVYWVDAFMLMQELTRLSVWLGAQMHQATSSIIKSLLLGWHLPFLAFGLWLILQFTMEGNRPWRRPMKRLKNITLTTCVLAACLIFLLAAAPDTEKNHWMVSPAFAKPVYDATLLEQIKYERNQIRLDQLQASEQSGLFTLNFSSPQLLRLTSTGYGSSGAGVFRIHDASQPGKPLFRPGRGVSLVGISVKGEAVQLAHADLCISPRGSMATPFAPVIEKHKDYLAFAVIVSDSAFCWDNIDLKPVLANTPLVKWPQITFRQAYISVFEPGGKVLEIFSNAGKASIYLQPKK